MPFSLTDDNYYFYIVTALISTSHITLFSKNYHLLLAMDFEKVLEILTREFTNEKIRYALIGGFAMGALGIVRSTMDLDFLVDSRDLEKIEKILKQYDYKCIYKTDNVSQYVSDIKLFGAIDFLHAFRKISLAMIKPLFLNNKKNMRN